MSDQALKASERAIVDRWPANRIGGREHAPYWVQCLRHRHLSELDIVLAENGFQRIGWRLWSGAVDHYGHRTGPGKMVVAMEREHDIALYSDGALGVVER